MGTVQRAGLVAAFVAAVGVGASLAPVAHGQAAAKAPQPAQARSQFVFSGGTAHIGVTVRDV
jgi:hypothetical protein